MSEIKIKSIVVDTFTASQKNEILDKWEKGKATQDDWKDYGTDIVLFARKLNEAGFTCVGVLGYEGTGKSFGMKYLPSETNIWFNADSKNPTWKGGKEEYGTINDRTKFMRTPKTYAEVHSFIKVVKDAGKLDDNPIAFLIAHIEDYKSTDGKVRQKLKTLGKLANKINIEDMLNMCYYTEVTKEGEKISYKLRTKNSGNDTCRTMEDLHDELYIDNNFQQIVEAIEKY